MGRPGTKIQHDMIRTSQCRRRNLTPISNLYKAALISMFWDPNVVNKLLQERFEFPFILKVKSTMAFLTGQSWWVLKYWFTSESLEQGFRRCFADGLNQSLVLSGTQARLEQDQILKKYLKLNMLFHGLKVYTEWWFIWWILQSTIWVDRS